ETGVEHFSIWRIGQAAENGAAPSAGQVVSVATVAGASADPDEAVGRAEAPNPALPAKPLARHAGRPAGRAAGPGVLLLGMHRSGTSLTTRLLGDTGLWLGEEADFLPAHPQDNPD